MKLRSTTPRKLVTKSTLVAAAVFMVVSGPMQLFAPMASADQWDDQIQALQQEISGYDAQAQKLSKQAASLSSEIARLQNEQATAQAAITLNTLKAKDLAEQIKTNEQKLADQEKVLSDTLVDIYFNGQTTPIEVLAGSKSLGDYVDRQSQRATVRDQVKYSTEQIKKLKAKLEEQKKEVESIIADQTVRKNQLEASRAKQAKLLADTQGQEANFQAKMKDARAQIVELNAQQKAAWAAATGGGNYSSGSVSGFTWRNYSGEQGCGGGYPWCGGGVDEFALYAGQCTSYTAWAAKYRFGKKVLSFQGEGNAYEWVNSGPKWMSARTDDTPEVGAAAVMPINELSSVGHVMIVEYITDDGWVGVSQYNFGGTEQFSTMEIPASSVKFVHFQ